MNKELANELLEKLDTEVKKLQEEKQLLSESNEVLRNINKRGAARVKELQDTLADKKDVIRDMNARLQSTLGGLEGARNGNGSKRVVQLSREVERLQRFNESLATELRRVGKALAGSSEKNRQLSKELHYVRAYTPAAEKRVEAELVEQQKCFNLQAAKLQKTVSENAELRQEAVKRDALYQELQRQYESLCRRLVVVENTNFFTAHKDLCQKLTTTLEELRASKFLEKKLRDDLRTARSANKTAELDELKVQLANAKAAFEQISSVVAGVKK